MLAFLIGFIDSKIFNPNSAFINVQGFGFLIYLSYNAWTKAEIGQEYKIYTVLNVSQENIKIYGFLEDWEKQLFELISSVKGIGAKSALALIDSINPSQITKAIIEENPTTLSAAPGIGKKTAERVIFELKPKVLELEIISQKSLRLNAGDILDIGQFAEISSILNSLGYSQINIDKALKANNEDNINTDDLLKKCLTWLSVPK